MCDLAQLLVIAQHVVICGGRFRKLPRLSLSSYLVFCALAFHRLQSSPSFFHPYNSCIQVATGVPARASVNMSHSACLRRR